MSKAKKWVDPQDVEITDLKHKVFIDGAVAGETDEERAKAIQEWANNHLLGLFGLTNASPAEKQWVLDQFHENQRQFDPDDVSLAGARKAINKLGAGDYAGVARTAQDSIEHREAIRQDTKAKIGAAGRETRIKKVAANKSAIIEDYLKNKSQFTKKDQAYHYYAGLYGIGWTTVRGYLTGV